MSQTLICKCRFGGRTDTGKVSAHAKEQHCVEIDDLCSLAVENPAQLKTICSDGTVVYGCAERTVRALLDFAGAEAKEVHSISGAGDTEAEPQGVWPAWYPVIDKTRCVNCGKCAQFCLFGVYTVSKGKISVANPKNCKNRCPACAKICPVQAVIFPKHPHAPVNGEEEANTGEKSAVSGEVQPELSERLRRRRNQSIFKEKPDA